MAGPTPAKAYKELQAIAAFEALEYLFVEGSKSKPDQEDFMHKKFHGDPKDSDCMPIYTQLTKGEGAYFKHLWNGDDEVKTEFGPLVAGLGKGVLGKDGSILKRSKGFVAGTAAKGTETAITGKKLLSDALAVLANVKLYASIWKDFLGPDGNFKSGTGADDAAKYVRQTTWIRSNPDLIDLSEEEGKKVVESDDDDESNDGEAGKPEKKKEDMPRNWHPEDFASFILYGPYGQSVFGTDQSTLFDVDASSLDRKKEKGGSGRRALKAAAAAAEDVKRITQPDRGLPSYEAVVSDRQERQLAIGAAVSRQSILKQQLDLVRGFFNEAESEEEKGFYRQKIFELKMSLSEPVDFSGFSSRVQRSVDFVTPAKKGFQATSFTGGSSGSSSVASATAARHDDDDDEEEEDADDDQNEDVGEGEGEDGESIETGAKRSAPSKSTPTAGAKGGEKGGAKEGEKEKQKKKVKQ
jgi:hypothetical protein